MNAHVAAPAHTNRFRDSSGCIWSHPIGGAQFLDPVEDDLETDFRSVEAEQDLLGIILADHVDAAKAFRSVKPTDFSEPLHGRIFCAGQSLRADGKSVSARSVAAALIDDVALFDVGGAAYLNELAENAYQRRDVGECIEIVRGWAEKRRTAETLSQVMERLSEPDTPLEHAMAPVEQFRAPRAATLEVRQVPKTEEPKTGKVFKVHRLSDLSGPLVSDYLVKGLMAPGELSVMYGEPGAGKSFLAAYVAYALSLDRQIFGRRVHPCAVLYVALEGENGFKRRVRALETRLGSSDAFNWIAETADLHSGDGHVDGIIIAANEHKARLIVIDTLARAMGAGSENEGQDMGVFIAAVDTIRRATGAHVCLVHHCGKDKTKGMRGHSSLLAAADLVIEVERSDMVRTFKIAKSKDGVDGESFSFDLEVIPLGADADGDPITSCVVRESGGASKVDRIITLTTGERGWLKDLHAIFAEPGAGEMLSPASGLTRLFCLTREQVRDGLKRKGRFSQNPDGTLTGADREKVRAALNSLKDKGRIGMTDKHVWLITERQ